MSRVNKKYQAWLKQAKAFDREPGKHYFEPTETVFYMLEFVLDCNDARSK